MMQVIKQSGHRWNHKRVYRNYIAMGLNLRIKPRKRLPSREAKCIIQPIQRNICWSIDFMSDALWQGHRFRTFNVIDDYNREGLGIYVDFGISAVKVTQCLDRLASIQGYPKIIRLDNGPEFTSLHFNSWAKMHHIQLDYIQPGKPAQNALIERFNRTYRQEVLDMNLFSCLDEVRTISQAWLVTYNQVRPHQALGNLPPLVFAKTRAALLVGNRG